MKKIDYCFVVVFVLLALLVGCKTHKEVELTKTISNEEYRGKQFVNVMSNDSVYTETNKYIVQHNDTVFVYNDVYQYRYILRDTVQQREEYKNNIDTFVLERTNYSKESVKPKVGLTFIDWVVLSVVFLALVWVVGFRRGGK